MWESKLCISRNFEFPWTPLWDHPSYVRLWSRRRGLVNLITALMKQGQVRHLTRHCGHCGQDGLHKSVSQSWTALAQTDHTYQTALKLIEKVAAGLKRSCNCESVTLFVNTHWQHVTEGNIVNRRVTDTVTRYNYNSKTTAVKNRWELSRTERRRGQKDQCQRPVPENPQFCHPYLESLKAVCGSLTSCYLDQRLQRYAGILSHSPRVILFLSCNRASTETLDITSLAASATWCSFRICILCGNVFYPGTMSFWWDPSSIHQHSSGYFTQVILHPQIMFQLLWFWQQDNYNTFKGVLS